MSTEGISLSPVPFEEELTISFSTPLSGSVHLVLHDMAGRLVDNRRMPSGPRLTVHYSGLAPGMYSLNLPRAIQLD